MASDKRCKCKMSISVLGDGCRYCQPQEYIDRMLEQIKDEAAPQPDTVEPVAWSWVSGGRHVTADKPYADQLVADGADVQPLYAHSPAKPDTVAVEREDLERWHSKLDRIGVREVTAEKIADELRALLDQEK